MKDSKLDSLFVINITTNISKTFNDQQYYGKIE